MITLTRGATHQKPFLFPSELCVPQQLTASSSCHTMIAPHSGETFNQKVSALPSATCDPLICGMTQTELFHKLWSIVGQNLLRQNFMPQWAPSLSRNLNSRHLQQPLKCQANCSNCLHRLWHNSTAASSLNPHCGQRL